jgi:hypothetical protein
MENDEFEQTNKNRRSQLIETQRMALAKFDNDCLSRYNVNIEQIMPNIKSTQNKNDAVNATSNSNQNLNGNSSLTSASNLRFYKGNSNSGSQLSLNTSKPSTRSSQQQSNLNYIINNANTSASIPSSPMAKPVALSSPADFVASLTNHQNNNSQTSNRASMLITSADYLNSPKLTQHQHHQQQQQQYYNHCQTAQQIHIVGENTQANQIQMRDSRTNSILNSSLKTNLNNDQPSSSNSIQANRRNSTAFT